MTDKTNYSRYKELKNAINIVYRGYVIRNILATDFIIFSFGKKINISTKKILSSIFFKKDITELVEKFGKQKVLFTTSDYGSHHRQLLDDIINYVPNSILLEESNKIKWRFSLKITVVSFFEIFFALKNKDLTLQQMLYFYLSLVNYKKIIDELENNVKIVKITKYVPFLNCLVPDSIYCQFFRLRGIKSYGIQHGQYSSGRYYKTIVPLDVVNVENFQADYMLGWGELMRESMLDEGFKSEQFLLAGNPKYFNINRIELKKLSFKSCIICLARDFYSKENLLLLAIGLQIKQNNTDVYIKLHPRSDISIYMPFINDNKLILLDKTVSVSESISNYNIDFAIVYNSTVYYEYYLKNIIAFRFAVNENDIPIGLEDDFCTFEDLIIRIDQYKNFDNQKLNEEANRIINKFCALGVNNYAKILN